MNDPTEARLMRYQPIKGTHIPITVFDEQGTILGAMKEVAPADTVLYRLPTKFERTHNYGLGPTRGETIKVVRIWPEDSV